MIRVLGFSFMVVTCVFVVRVWLAMLMNTYVSWFAWDFDRAVKSPAFPVFMAIMLLSSWGVIDVIGRSIRELRRP